MTISTRIASLAADHPQRVALLAPERQPLDIATIHDRVLALVDRLNRAGVGRGDVLALALPDGPDLALTFLAAASCCICAPLNPAYRQSEFEFYLRDLAPRALVLPAGLEGPARSAAINAGVPLFELAAQTGAAAGVFELQAQTQARSLSSGPGEADDIALVLHTSGTTARPKIVPLRQRHLVVSAENIAKTLRLTPDDRCLNVMPLFHIHGLVAGLLAPILSGGSVVCPPGFLAPRFFEWIAAFEPSWYTAVPTMHQAILARAPENAAVIHHSRLRFVRSSSASLAPQIMTQLEQVIGVPVIEAYGMTEAAHQMASNPLPPAPRKPGTVGLAAGPEVAIMAEDTATMKPAGEPGEIVIRGENVMSGYLNNPEADQRAFVDGWFRTGDLGRIDAEGYLTILGRLKEIINRGGEKISPREVDEVLLKHANVRQAVAFALPDPVLGEQVAAAVVLLDPEAATGEDELRRFAALYLADFKVPMRIVLVPEIPKGPTGKLQRIGLAEKLGIQSLQVDESEIAYEAPRSDLERALYPLWVEVLGETQFGIHHRFLGLGGDSVLAARIASRYQQTYEISFTLIDFFNFPTIAGHARLIEDRILAQIASLSDEEAAQQLNE